MNDEIQAGSSTRVSASSVAWVAPGWSLYRLYQVARKAPAPDAGGFGHLHEYLEVLHFAALRTTKQAGQRPSGRCSADEADQQLPQIRYSLWRICCQLIDRCLQAEALAILP